MERGSDAAEFHELAERAERRAARAREHADAAREQAVGDALRGDARHERLHRREAELHEAAAARNAETAALFRRRAEQLANRRSA